MPQIKWYAFGAKDIMLNRKGTPTPEEYWLDSSRTELSEAGKKTVARGRHTATYEKPNNYPWTREVKLTMSSAEQGLSLSELKDIAEMLIDIHIRRGFFLSRDQIVEEPRIIQEDPGHVYTRFTFKGEAE